MAQPILTPRLLLALELNEYLNNTFYFPFKIHWNNKTKQVECQKRRLGVAMYYFTNLIVIIGFVSCLYLISDSMFHPQRYPIDQIYVYIVLILASNAVVGTNYLLSRDCEHFCKTLNRLCDFERESRALERRRFGT